MAENQKVIVPFMPTESGKRYDPYTKDQPALLAMYFHASRILRPIEHIDHAALSKGCSSKT